MRKLWILVIGGLALLPFAALADTGDAVEATLSLTDVINVSATGTPTLTVTQEDTIAGYAGGLLSFTGNIVVEVLAMTNYMVWAAYFSNIDESTFGNANKILALDDGTTYDLAYNSTLDGTSGLTDGFDVSDYGLTFGTEMTDLNFTGTNNLGNTPPGDTKTYTLKLYPGNLGDRKAGENITFTIVFMVQDTTI